MNGTDGLARRVAATLLAAVVYWAVAAGLLALVVRRGRMTASWADTGGPATAGRQVGFVDLYAAILTFDFGRSASAAVPTAEVIAPALGETVAVLAVTAVFVVLFGVALVGVRRGLAAAVGDRIAGLPVALAGAVPPVAALFALILIGTRWRLPYPVLWREGIGVLGYVLPAVPLALPGAAVLASRDWSARSRSIGELRRGLAALSAYALYLVGGLVAVETLFVIPGVGQHWFRGILYEDGGLLVGTTAVAVAALIAVGVVRDLVEVVGELTLPADPESAAPAEGETAPPATQHAGTVAERVRGEPLVLVGAAGLVLCLLVGLAGAATTGVSIGPRTGEQLLPRFLTALASLSLVATVALVTSSLVGVGSGLVGWRASSTVRGGLRRVLDFGAVLPILPFAVLWRYTGPQRLVGDSPLGVELWTGVLGGLLLVPLVHRATTASLGRDDATPAGAAVGGLGEAATYAPFVGFVVVELGVLGVHHAAAPVVLQTGPPMLSVPEAFGGVVGYALPAVALLVLGDSLRRASGSSTRP